MKVTYMKRAVALLICFVTLLCLGALTVTAEEEYVPLEWKMDENVEYLYGGEKRYERYYVKGAFYGDARKAFYFMNKALYEGRECQVYGESAYPHIVSVYNGEGYSYVFTDDEGRRILDRFLDRTECIYYLEEFGVKYAVWERDFVDTLDMAYKSKVAELTTVAVNELSEGEIYEVTVHDPYEMKAYQHGAVYLMPDGTYYYVCFDGLDNSYFDADGYFSYRAGSVKALELGATLQMKIDATVEEMQPKNRKIVYEHNVVRGTVDVDGNPIDEDDGGSVDFGGPLALGPKDAAVVFWVCFTILGFILPTPLLILGLTLPHSRKTSGSNTWYLLAGCAGVWITAAFVLALVLLL